MIYYHCYIPYMHAFFILMFCVYFLWVTYLVRWNFNCRCYTSKEKKRILRPLFKILFESLRSRVIRILCSVSASIFLVLPWLLFDYVGCWSRGVDYVLQENAISCSGCLLSQVATLTFISKDIIICKNWMNMSKENLMLLRSLSQDWTDIYLWIWLYSIGACYFLS